MSPHFIITAVFLLCAGLLSEKVQADVPSLDALLNKYPTPFLEKRPVGLTKTQQRIWALIGEDDVDLSTSKTRLLLVSGYDGQMDSVEATLSCIQWFRSDAAAEWRKRYTLTAVPITDPERFRPNGVGGSRPKFPPGPNAYGGVAQPGAAYLWRWIGMHAPDLVIEIRNAKTSGVFLPPSDDVHLRALGQPASIFAAGEEQSLVAQLARRAPSGTGLVPAVRLHLPGGEASRVLEVLLGQLDAHGFRGPSPARSELQRRFARSSVEIAQDLSRHYGHALDTVAYIPAVALIGRLRLGELLGSSDSLADVERIVEPYVTGAQPSLPEKTRGSHLSGHLVFSELARLTSAQTYTKLVLNAANLAFENGQPLEAMPTHTEMSDAVFMGCPILAEAGRLTGDDKYFNMCLRHMRYMRALNLRSDGLHRHSPMDQAAWGRGNGFPALGLALSLSAWPKDHPDYEEMLTAFRAHIGALVKHQDPTGVWHQVVDEPASYGELSSTCMITFAIARGLRSGWLDAETYRPVVEKAWNAIRLRIGVGGHLVDVCTGTGKQKNLQAYFDRRAILGPDPRGGAMALLVTTEIAFLERE